VKKTIKILKQLIYTEISLYHIKKAYKFSDFNTIRMYHMEKSDYYFKKGQQL
jgi:hypothetical protein